MAIQAKHFDVRLNKWIHLDGDQNNPESILQEKISNTLLERFLPGKEFSFGHIDDQVTEEQMTNHPDGHKLLLSSGTRLLYGPEECLEIINQICPDVKDRGAYGSLFLGGCRSAIDTGLNILVVDDSNGENGDIIDNNQAYRLTGDCYGQIADNVYRQLTGHEDGDKYKVIQHRIGWNKSDGDDDKFRFGKGTLRPANLDSETLSYTDQNNKPKIDIIIPLSSFKGTDKDNPNGPTKAQIKPGLYKENVWLGEKSQSALGKTAISQVLASFPQGVKDFTETVELEAQKLAEAEKDPRKLAQLYCEKYEKRKDYLEGEADELVLEIGEEFSEDKQNNLLKLRERLENDSFIYKIIKNDLAGDGQLLETEKVKNELTKFVQGEWRDIAIGKKLQFERALVIPSKDLKNGEIFIPKYNEGDEVLNFRSPFLNSNGMCVSKNIAVNDALGPDKKPIDGIIVVSDETSKDIYKRLSKQIESVLPQAIAVNAKIDGIEQYINQDGYKKLENNDKIEFTDKFNEYVKALNEAGFDMEILPYESEQERQARDYDGDCIGFEKASKYPNLAEEAIERNLPGNGYAPTVKMPKQSSYDETGGQPPFEALAKHMSDGISVGVISNHLTTVEALESEIEIIMGFNDSMQQASAYVEHVGNHYRNLLDAEDPEKPQTMLSDKYRGYMQDFVRYADAAKGENSKEFIERAMATNKQMYRELNADASFQNQIAVDMPKSYRKPDMESIRLNSKLLHRQVNYIRDKKDKNVYDTSTIEPTGFSPVELIVAKTNQYFRTAQLESRDLTQFQDLFKDVEYTNQQRLQATLAKKEFDTSFNAATRFSKRRETEKGPSVELQLAGDDDKKLDVSNLLDSKNDAIWNAFTIKVMVKAIDEKYISSSKPHRYAVYAQIDGQVDDNGKPKFSRLGKISKEQEYGFLKDSGIKLGEVMTVKSHKLKAPLSEGQVKLLYNQAFEVARNFYASVPDDQKQSMAAAAWAISTTRESGSNKKNKDGKQQDTVDGSEVQQEVERIKKVSNFVFAAFENEVIERTDTLQFSQAKVTGFNKDSTVFKQDVVDIRYNIDTNGKDIIEVKNDLDEYVPFATLEQQAGRMPIGTTATAAITYGAAFIAMATTQIPGQPPKTFKIGEMSKGNLGEVNLDGVQELSISRDTKVKEDYVLSIKGERNQKIKFGKLDDKSVEEGIKEGWLDPKGGQNLKLKITQIVSGANGYAIGETPKGNMLRINLDEKYKYKNIQAKSYRDFTVNAYNTEKCNVSIGGQRLGTISEAELNKTQVLEKGANSTTIPVTIEKNITTAKIALVPESIKYPDQWAKRHQLLNTTQNDVSEQQSSHEAISNKILSEINDRPTILFQSQAQKASGVIGLSIDDSRVEATKKFLDQKEIKYTAIPWSDAKTERSKGVAVLMLEESTISADVMDALVKRASGIKNADAPAQTPPITPEQAIYYTDPNQQAIGFVVPNKLANITQAWLSAQGADTNRIQDGNTSIITITNASISESLSNKLDATFSQPIDVSTVEGFDKYDADRQNLSESVKNNEIDTKPSSKVEYSEYQTELLKLAYRPKNLQLQVDESLPIAPAVPLDEAIKPNTAQVKVQVETEPTAALQPKDIYKSIQNNSLSLPPNSVGVDNTTYTDDSPMRTGILINAKEHVFLDSHESTIVAVDFRNIETVRNSLYENGIEYSEPIAMDYEVGGIDDLSSSLKDKGYYTFVVDSGNLPSDSLTNIKEAVNIQQEYNISSEDAILEDDQFKDAIAQLPNATQDVQLAIAQYIEDADLFLDQWKQYIQSQPEQFSTIINEVKNIIQLYAEASESMDGNKVDEVAQLKAKTIEKYGEESYQKIEAKAKAVIATENLEAKNPVTIIRFKGVHDEDTNQNHGGIEIIPTGGKGEIVRLSRSLGEGTSRQAEYQALIVGLKKAKEAGATNIRIEGNSPDTISQLQGRFKVNNDALKPLYDEAKQLMDSFDNVAIKNIAGYENSTALKLAQSGVQSVKVEKIKTKATGTIAQIVEDAKLNSEQTEALTKMVAFTKQPKSGNAKDNEFLLTGYAGTGKTYTIQQLLKAIEAEGRKPEICLTAPTNAAVKVLRKMGQREGLDAQTKTTHKLLGLKEQFDKVTGEVSYDIDKSDKKRRPEYLNYDAIVVDESSMVNKQLREKLREVAQQGVKIIYMGDKAQLPPVNEEESLVFQIENRADLTETMRYGGDIGATATSIRNDIENPNPPTINSSPDGTIVTFNAKNFKDNVTELFKTDTFKEDNSSVKILAYTNKRVDEINAIVKNELFGKDAPEYVEGMRIIARAAVVDENGIPLLQNSDEMTITNATKVDVDNYKVWALTGMNEENEEVTLCTIAQESKQQFKNDTEKLFNIERAKPSNDRDWSIPYGFRDQFADVRPAYAITVHNSQGKTIKIGGVDEQNIDTRRRMALAESNPQKQERGIKEHNQLMYVAMTRFEEKIFVLGAQREVSLSREEKLAQAKASLNKQVESQPEKPQQSNILEATSGIIIQQVNPKGITIGSGFNQSLGEKYPQIIDNFNANQIKGKDDKKVTGSVNFIQINDNLYVAQIPSQIGSDIKSKQTNLQKLSDGLKEVAEFATQNNLQVQVPQGLGVDGVSAQERMKSWETIQATVKNTIKDAIVLPQNPEAIADIRERNKLLTEPPTPAIIELVANAERIDSQQFSSAFKELSDKEVKWLMVNAGVGSEGLPNPKDEKLCTAILEDIFVDNYARLKDETTSKISVDVVQEIKQIIIRESNAESPEQEQNAVNDRMKLIEKYGELYPQLEAKAEQLIKQDKVSSKQNNQTIVEAIESASGQQPINLPSSVDADKTKPIEIMGKVSDVKVDALLKHIETNLKPLLLDDKSNYSPGRQVAWVGAEWDLKNKDFKPGIRDEKLMELVKQVYPDAAIALVTYSPNPGAGINYHRDDSYAANEARSINIGDSEWGYRAAKQGMAVSRDENDAAKYQEFPLESGTVTRFNCKNEHAAINTEAGRWSINIWSIKNDLGRENSVREKYNNFVASNQPPRAIVESKNDLTIKANEWSPGGEIKVERSFDSLKDATKNKQTTVTTPVPQTNSTINIVDIIKIGNDTQLRAANPVVPNDAKISGKPVVMAWELTNPDKNVKGVTTIDAMRTDSRVHSTRSEDYYKKYNIKEGDIALAQGKDGSKVAFRVGKQYKITQDVIDNPDYQRAWVKWEKHDIKELTGRQAEKVNEGRPLYGLFMEPLGDYNNGKIVPFSQVQQQQSSQEPPLLTTETLKINPTTGVGLGAVLSNATVLAKESNNLRNDYQVSVNGNPEAPAGVYGRENQAFKPDGVPYNSAEHAFEHQKQVTPDKDPYKIMVEVLQAKLQQHPNIVNTIEKKGGLVYLENSQIINETDKQWEGKGKESKFIQALTEAYTNVVEKSQSQSNPLASVKPLNDAVAKHMAVDVAMGQVATQFIGKSSAPSTTQSTTRNYEAAWNKSANTGNYSSCDTIMVSGSGPWRGVTNQQINQTFENHYKPLLDRAIAAKASFVVGTAEGTDKLVQNYLKENGYKLEHNKQGYIEATANEKTITKESTPSKEATPSKESIPPKESTSPKESAPPIESTPPKAEIRNNVAPGVIISSRSSSPLGAALTSTTVKSRSRGSIDKDYPVSFRDNPALAKGSYGPESYATDKPAGQPFASAEQAMLVYKETVKDLGEARVNLLAQIQQAKFEQHPDLLQAVTDNGGVEWLKQCEYKVGSKNDFWEGKGEESPFIRSLVKGYESAMGITNTNESAPTIRFVPDESISTPTPPCESIADTPTTPKSIPNVTSPTTRSEKSHNIPAFGSIDNAIGNARNAMLDTLSNWQELARKLGKSEEYLTGIAEVIDKYQTQNVGLEEGLAAMSRDMKEAERLNDVTRMAQRIANTVGRMDNVNNVLSAKTTNGYEFSIAKNDKNLLIRDKPENGGNILLYIKDGQIKENKIDDKFVTDLRKMNFAIDNALTDVKKQLVV